MLKRTPSGPSPRFSTPTMPLRCAGGWVYAEDEFLYFAETVDIGFFMGEKGRGSSKNFSIFKLISKKDIRMVYLYRFAMFWRKSNM